jgi:hypothetical protein
MVRSEAIMPHMMEEWEWTISRMYLTNVASCAVISG